MYLCGETVAFAGRKNWRHTWRQLQWIRSDYGIRSSAQRQTAEIELTGYHSTQPKQTGNAKVEYHSPSPCTQTEEAGCYSSRPNLNTNTQDTTFLTRDEALRCKPEGRGFFGIFIDDTSVRSMALGSIRHLHVPIVLKSGSLNLLESSEPLQVCMWITFLFCHSSYCRECH